MKVVIHSKRRLLDDFFNVDEALVSFQRFDGRMTPLIRRLSLERGDSVSAILFNRSTGKVILVRQFKYPTYAKGPGWVTEAVAGMIAEGERPEEAVRREVLEETGYVAGDLTEIATFYVSPGGSSERVFLFYGEVEDSDRQDPGGGLASETEDIETVEYTMAALRQKLAQREIVDAKTIIGVLWLRDKLRNTRGEDPTDQSTGRGGDTNE